MPRALNKDTTFINAPAPGCGQSVVVTDPKFDREAHRLQRIDWVHEMGAPIFVPKGRQFANWKILGMGRGGTPLVTTRVTVESTYWNPRRELEVETHLNGALTLRDNFSAGILLSYTVPDDVSFPYTSTVTQRELTIRVDAAGEVELRVLEANGAWCGRGQIGGRWIGLRGWGVAPDDISLATVHDLEALPEKRWA